MANFKFYPASPACDFTSTERFSVICDCPTYEGNAGVCDTYEEGGNGRCVYCDHTKRCHKVLQELKIR